MMSVRFVMLISEMVMRMLWRNHAIISIANLMDTVPNAITGSTERRIYESN
jgi:hypothetical protein